MLEDLWKKKNQNNNFDLTWEVFMYVFVFKD